MIENKPYYSPCTVYKCPICGTVYDSYDGADMCVKWHPISSMSVKGFTDWNVVLNIPDGLVVTFSDGRVFEYLWQKEVTPKKEENKNEND